MPDIDLAVLRDRIFNKLELSGAVAWGVCTTETLAGGPPSTDLTRELPSAKSCVAFAMPLNDEHIETYMAKTDHDSHQHDYIRTNTTTQGISAEIAHSLRGMGFEAAAVFAGNTINAGHGSGSMEPTTDAQKAAAERYPASDADQMMGLMPVLSQRYLAVAAGVGFIGMSGNVLTESHGATVVLGAAVTNAELEATNPLPPEVNYCDECNWCGSVCPTDYMSRDTFVKVEIGKRTHQYAERGHAGRCGAHMMGTAGLAPNGKFSSWGPSRKPLPDDDGELLMAMMMGAGDLADRPDPAGGFQMLNQADKTNIMCSACNLVCHPEREVRQRRLRAWRTGGVSIQHEDGRVEMVTPEQADAHLAAMTPERRALYE